MNVTPPHAAIRRELVAIACDLLNVEMEHHQSDNPTPLLLAERLRVALPRLVEIAERFAEPPDLSKLGTYTITRSAPVVVEVYGGGGGGSSGGHGGTE